MYEICCAPEAPVAHGCTTAAHRPWEREGLSRAEWYRRTRYAPIGRARSMDALRWYCVRTQDGQEKTAAEEIEALGFAVFAPTIFKPATRRRRNSVGALIPAKAAGTAPLFRDYIFSRFRLLDRWQHIRGAASVDTILGTGSETPEAVPERAMDLIRGMCDANGCYHEDGEVPNTLVGALLRVMDGAFSSFEGVCDWSEDGRVRVLLSMFGRRCPVVVDQEAVELV